MSTKIALKNNKTRIQMTLAQQLKAETKKAEKLAKAFSKAAKKERRP